MKQRSIREYTGSPLRDYNIVSTEWLGKSGNESPKSTKVKTRSAKSRSSKINKPQSRKPISQHSPLGKWIQHTACFNESQIVDKNEKSISKPSKKPIVYRESCEENNITHPTVDDVLKNINRLKKEEKILDDLFKENDTSMLVGSLNDSAESTEGDSASSTKIKTYSSNSKSWFKNKFNKPETHKPNTEVMSPLEKWLQRKNNNKLHNKDKDGKKASELNKKKFRKTDSFEKYGVVLPTVDDILKNKNTMKEEGRILDDYDYLFAESDISIPSLMNVLLDSPEKISIPLLTCEHLSQLELKIYFTKYLDHLKDISKGLVFSGRHQTYKDHNSRSKLTYSFSTVVFSEFQLEYLMKEIENALDPEEKRTEYLFMVILPELCMQICMDEFDMSKEEVVDYLNRRPVD